MTKSNKLPWFVRGDLDGFFGLFVDNLVQLLLIQALCSSLCGMSGEAAGLLYDRVLPGAAISILVGNLFYAWQARRVALREGRRDVTALPYGINTPSLLVYIFFVLAPAYQRASGEGRTQLEAATFAWESGLVACFGSAVIEFGGAFIAGAVRRCTPRAALLSTLAGIAVGFIAMSFLLQIFQKPLIAMPALGIVLLTYFSRIRFPGGLPGGFVSLLAGTAVAWGLTAFESSGFSLPAWATGMSMSVQRVRDSLGLLGLHWPQWAVPSLLRHLQDSELWMGQLSVIVPMGLFNLMGSLQNIESAEASGDRFSTWSSLAANGLGSMSAACFGSCFPTTIYIGHPGWKQLGARTGYSTLNGIAILLLCLTGSVSLVSSLVPLEAGIPIVLWIGVIITAQAFAANEPKHAPAVALGLFPAIAAWGFTVVQGAFFASGGRTIQQLLADAPAMEVNGYLLHGLIVLERGYIITCMLISALAASLIDRRFYAAMLWSLAGAVCAGYGLTHAYQLSGNAVDFLLFGMAPSTSAKAFSGVGIAVGYLACAAAFGICGLLQSRYGRLPEAEH